MYLTVSKSSSIIICCAKLMTFKITAKDSVAKTSNRMHGDCCSRTPNSIGLFSLKSFKRFYKPIWDAMSCTPLIICSLMLWWPLINISEARYKSVNLVMMHGRSSLSSLLTIAYCVGLLMKVLLMLLTTLLTSMSSANAMLL